MTKHVNTQMSHLLLLLLLLLVSTSQAYRYGNVLHHLTHPLNLSTTDPATTTSAPTTQAPTGTPPPYTPSPPTPYPTTAPTIPPSTGPPTTPGPSNPVTYHNGPVLVPIPTMYILFYGDINTTAPGAIELINDFASNLNGSAPMNIMTQYYQIVSGVTTYGTNQMIYGGNVNNASYPYGTAVGTSVPSIMFDDLIRSGVWSYNPLAVYIFVLSNDCSFVTICSGLCGFHGGFSNTDVGGGGQMRTAVIGNCASGCSIGSPTPNDNQAAENMINILWHEWIEALSDPNGSSGWHDATGSDNEIADRCAHNYGTTYAAASNGAPANCHVGSKDYKIQTIWNQIGLGSCSF